MTIVGWKSPVGGTVNVNATFSSMNPDCGDGVTWYVEKGNSTLSTGYLPPGPFVPGEKFGAYNADVFVLPGEFLYFIVNGDVKGYGDYYCDQIDLDLVITKVAADAHGAVP